MFYSQCRLFLVQQIQILQIIQIIARIFKVRIFSDFFFSDFDLKQLPLTYGRMDLQRKFTFDFIPVDLYRPYVSAYITCVLT